MNRILPATTNGATRRRLMTLPSSMNLDILQLRSYHAQLRRNYLYYDTAGSATSWWKRSMPRCIPVRLVTVSATLLGRDRYGRTLGAVILSDGRNLNHEILKAGYAWWFRKYSKDASLGDLEDEARQAKRGLWADPEPVPPWEWRSKYKQTGSSSY